MDLDEYLWRNKIKNKDFAALCGVANHTISSTVHGRLTPSLLSAIRIIECSNGSVTYKDLLRKKDRDKLSQIEKKRTRVDQKDLAQLDE